MTICSTKYHFYQKIVAQHSKVAQKYKKCGTTCICSTLFLHKMWNKNYLNLYNLVENYGFKK